MAVLLSAGAAPGTAYFAFALHRLYEDQYRSVIKRLREHFIHGPRPVTQWSVQLAQPRTKEVVQIMAQLKDETSLEEIAQNLERLH